MSGAADFLKSFQPETIGRSFGLANFARPQHDVCEYDVIVITFFLPTWYSTLGTRFVLSRRPPLE